MLALAISNMLPAGAADLERDNGRDCRRGRPSDLRRDFPEMIGLSARNLNYMRAFAETYADQAIVQQRLPQLPWGRNVRLIEIVKDSMVNFTGLESIDGTFAVQP